MPFAARPYYASPMRSAVSLLLLIVIPLLLLSCAHSRQAPPRLTMVTPPPQVNSTPKAASELLAAWARTDRFRSGTPVAFTPVQDGSAVLFLRTSKGSTVRDLYELDCSTGLTRVLATASDLLQGMAEKLSAEELARRERMRLNSRGIGSYSLSKDGTVVLIPLSDRLFLLTRATGAIRELKGPSDFPLDPRLSDDGRLVASVRNNEVILMEVESGKHWAATSGAAGTVTNGTAEFVAQEEMGRSRGYWLSPDNSLLCFQQTDTSGVETFYIGDPADPAKTPATWPYPRAGKQNATVRLGLTAITPGATPGEVRWITWDAQTYPYVATVTWTKNSPLTLLVQNRTQTEQVLLRVDTATGATYPLLTERDGAWLNIFQSCPKWLDDGSGFLWVTEQYDGRDALPAGTDHPRLELRNADGSLRAAITPPGFPMVDCISLDQVARCAYISTCSYPSRLNSAMVRLDSPGGEPLAINDGPGQYGLTFSKNHSIAVESSVTLASLPTWKVKRLTPGQGLTQTIAEIESLAEAPPMLPKVEITTVTNAQGHEFYCSIVRPSNFTTKQRYPVIVLVYGGPAAPGVDTNGMGYLADQYYAEHGFVVVSIDNRGTGRRGRAWERSIKDNFIDTALDDQVQALALLGAKYPELDLTRVGIFGWSFGGYFSAMAAMKRPDIYSCAIAGAPVCAWEDYDTHYTERYMSLPEANQKGYAASNVLTFCKDLQVPLMIIHGTADDNVYFVHGLKMATELFRHGKAFEFVPLSGYTHMITTPQTVIDLHTRQARFFQRELLRARPAH